MRYIWLIPLLPGIGAAINGVVGVPYFSRKTAGTVACATMAAALALSILAFWQLLGLPEDGRWYDVTVAPWFSAIPLQLDNGTIGRFEVPWSFRLDPLSGMMILVVTGIGTLIHIYSTAYMADEPRGGVARYFCYLNLFCFFMLMLVLGSNFLVMFVGWEGVGLCSYLLIGYWYEKKSASDAGKKAFITNRIGDWGFILGMFLVFQTFGTLDFRAVQDASAAMPAEAAEFGVLSAICLLLFVGATGKSAQIPLYVWLPDAMEGPTPVSALIHAATMVTAGVYMVGRNAVLFSHAPMVMQIVAIVGVLTALMAATIGLVQNDIKRVLAYSTVSQLGYMFTAMGVGAFAAGAFHLMTHAFFKALLFLGSGSVIHAMAGEQDMRRMGGLKKYLPVTFITMMIGTLAIAGIPPLAGFFSKDEILFRAFIANKAIWALGVATAFMTAFYMFRLMSMTFFGGYRGPVWEAVGHGSSAAVGSHGHALRASAADIHAASRHGAPHPADPHAHGQAHLAEHEVSHGPADAGGHGADARGHDDAQHGGHGHGPWHGPHESPTPMTFPLMALAVGAMVAGFFGIPAALGGGNAIEHFLHPSFTASAAHGSGGEVGHAAPAAEAPPAAAQEAGADAHAADASPAEEHPSAAAELGLMGLSILIALAGIGLAWKFYVTSPEISDHLAAQWAGAHRTLSNKYYVDELYNGTLIAGTMAGARNLWTFDRRVVDGAVNGSGWATLFSSWISGLTDRHVVDGAVNLVGWTAYEGSYWFRRLQTGLVQNYALLMLFGIFAFVSIYLIMR
jgi:NADH-quinone oxidoreductase subunit L